MVDFYLVWFIAIFLSRRVVWHILRQVMLPFYSVYFVLTNFVTFLLYVVMINLGTSSLHNNNCNIELDKYVSKS